jgi:flavin reductase (DIM6/NTAB) family NADH-FMN oxidoreductase RutF
VSADDRKHSLGAALGRIPSGLFVVTVRHGDAETGMLASWVQQCSFEPPQISVAVKQGRDVLAWLTDGAPFTLNVLDDSQTDMLIHFGKGFQLDEPAFNGLEV